MHRHVLPSLFLVGSLALSTGLLGCTAGAPAESGAEADPTPHQASFDAEASVASWVELWATYDLDMVDELFLAGADPTYFSSEKQGLIVGLDAIREHHAGFGFVPGGSPPENDLWLEDVHTKVFGSTAVVNAVWLFGDRSSIVAEERPSVQKGPMTAVFVFDGERYKIAHMHFAEYLPVDGLEPEGGR